MNKKLNFRDHGPLHAQRDFLIVHSRLSEDQRPSKNQSHKALYLHKDSYLIPLTP
jgi:hypothetical protein